MGRVGSILYNTCFSVGSLNEHDNVVILNMKIINTEKKKIINNFLLNSDSIHV